MVMATAIKTKEQKQTRTGTDYGRFFGEMYAFNNSLKLFHWHVSTPAAMHSIWRWTKR